MSEEQTMAGKGSSQLLIRYTTGKVPERVAVETL